MYIVKPGVYSGIHFFLFLLQNIDCGSSLEPPHLTEAVLTCTHDLCFEQKYEKYHNFSSKNYHFFTAIRNCCILLMFSYGSFFIFCLGLDFAALYSYDSDEFITWYPQLVSKS